MSDTPTQSDPSSHVKNAPNSLEGHNFDPQIRTQYANEPKVVHTARQPEMVPSQVNMDNKKRHDESTRRYPHLNLSDGEFVVLDVKRHPIGLLLPILATSVTILAMMAVLILYPADSTTGIGASLPAYGTILAVMILMMLLVGVGGLVAIWVYLQNQFYMTNESVIQEIQHGLFSRHEQTVSLGSIEDASFKQSGLLQTLLNYGTVRLSTEGEETTYSFSFVRNPRRHIAILNNAIEAFKNGRPVDPYES